MPRLKNELKTIEQLAQEKGANLSEEYGKLVETVEDEDSVIGYITAWHMSENPLMKGRFFQNMLDTLTRRNRIEDYSSAIIFCRAIGEDNYVNKLLSDMIEAHPVLGRINYLPVLIASYISPAY